MHTFPKVLAGASLALALAASGSAQAGTWATMTIDNDFSDWAGVPVLDSDAADNVGGVDIADIQIANDATHLYLRITYHGALSVSTFLAFDTDESVATGFDVFGLALIGSEVGYQNDFPFDQRTGFNVGGVDQGALIAPDWWIDASSKELSFPLNSLYTNDNAPVFPDDDFNLLVWTDGAPNGDVSAPVYYQLGIPEPASMALIGLGGLALLRRRR